uniref:glucosamine-6-phosphate deaminase n=1 Tax=uncultured Allobacillus sp. TaxID=1638025 RepID=UPI00259AA80B|nr:glucosamine-6-phosphate deaminase [uncultured Allobacillus sp.]
MNVIVVKNYEEVCQKGVEFFIEQIQKKNNINLGLATGSTPLGLYDKLIEWAQEKNADLSHVTTFNLDEYIGLPKDDPNSYYYYMKEKLFDPLNLSPEQTFLPDGRATDIEKECQAYDQLIKDKGGIDLQLLGVGVNGHIAFNEPGTSFSSNTHEVRLAESTREANSRFFSSMDEVPTHAITMGIGSILEAKEIVLIANGKNKSEAIQQLVEGPQSEDWPITALQSHDHVTVIVDEEAASLLKK